MSILQMILIYAIVGTLTVWYYNPLGVLKQEVEKDAGLRCAPEVQKFLMWFLIIFVGVLWPLYLVSCAGFAIARKFK